MHPVEGLPALDLLTALPGNPCLIQRPEGGRPFERVSDFQPAGDQPQAIAEPGRGLAAAGAAFAAGQTLEERLRGLIREVIEEVASEGRAAIVAHGASMALWGREGVLKVLLTASPDERGRTYGMGERAERGTRRDGGA